ncbi:MAG TPA: DUF179 domain-containing protein [Hellea balneolensis]|uniref:UPF0301 protein ENK01_02805 n=1 Tax=Hellea balneolensis TaxID=287478 RepID=A0A7V5U184_9PROT|nr:DUF179 domain-containing protein [Hellea balneolensis]
MSETPQFNAEHSLAGHFLVAGPSMRDERFANSVILMCVHNSEQAMGIILNKPKPDLTLSTMLPALDINGAPTHEDSPVLYGGPVETERGFVLHSRDYYEPKNALPISDTLALSTSKSVLKALTTSEAPRHAVLALGYAGWAGGQLEFEMMRNDWLITPASDQIVFSSDASKKWKQALALAGISPEFLSSGSGTA